MRNSPRCHGAVRHQCIVSPITTVVMLLVHITTYRKNFPWNSSLQITIDHLELCTLLTFIFYCKLHLFIISSKLHWYNIFFIWLDNLLSYLVNFTRSFHIWRTSKRPHFISLQSSNIRTLKYVFGINNT